MDIQWWEVVGLVGVTLVLSAGRIFESLREWLLGFHNAWSPFRVVGELLRCSMCCGMWVGWFWGFFVMGLSWYGSLILGGLISLTSLATDEVMGIIGLYRLLRSKRNQGAMTMEEMVHARQQIKASKDSRHADLMNRERARKRGTPRDISEDEADAYVDAQEDAADAIVMGEPPPGAS